MKWPRRKWQISTSQLAVLSPGLGSFDIGSLLTLGGGRFRGIARRAGRRSRDPGEVRRTLATLGVAEGRPVAVVARSIAAARSSIYRWLSWFRLAGVDGLRSGQRGRPATTVSGEVIEKVTESLELSPRSFGYLRSHWTSEMLTKE